MGARDSKSLQCYCHELMREGGCADLVGLEVGLSAQDAL